MKKIKLPITLLMAAGMLSLAPLGAQAASDTTAQSATNASVSGKIVQLGTDSIEIKCHKGMAQTFAINSETKYGTTEKAEKYEDFKDGEHVRINYAEVDGKQVATQIQELPAHHHGKS
jgi:Cu/Ag efflux protein CusF